MIIKKPELKFLCKDPGAVKHGNFINYYSFNSVQSRLEHLHHQMFPMPDTEKILVLDVGCNSGDLTNALHNYMQERYDYSPIEILAIDLDPDLIASAQKTNQLSKNLHFEVSDIMNEDGKTLIREFLAKHERERFDFTFCFSVTMWIHLNHGDSGLTEFLKYVQSISTSIIIEPQQWKCYKAAQKRLKRADSSFEKFDTLQIREKVESYIEDTILEGNFTKTFQSVQTNWGRTVRCYRATESNINSFIQCL